MKRIFLGVPLSLEVASNVAPLVLELKQTGGEFTSVALENLHFTVKFLGDVEEKNIPSIKEKMSTFLCCQKPFSVAVKGVGVFHSHKRINVVWIGGESSAMISLLRQINTILAFGRKKSHETITPHATVARVKSGKNTLKIQEFVERHRWDNFGSMVVDTAVLYESTLTSLGPIYMVLEKFNLREANMKPSVTNPFPSVLKDNFTSARGMSLTGNADLRRKT